MDKISSRQWRGGALIVESSVVVLEGVVYHHLTYPACIAALEVNNEKPVASTISLPVKVATAVDWCLGLSQGQIQCISMDFGKINVWRFNNTEKRLWELRYKLDVRQLMDSCSRRVVRNARTMYCPFVLVGFSPDRDAIYLNMHDGIVAFDHLSYTFVDFYDMHFEGLSVFANLRAFPFFPTLYDPSKV